MNIYAKYCPNVFLAKCEEEYKKGDVITMQTKHGKEHECTVHNFIGKGNGYFFYSITRADGYNHQERMKAKAERIQGWAASAAKKSDQYYEASKEGRDFLALGEPIKVGHHSEKRHRSLIERNHNRMGKSVEFDRKADEYLQRADYWNNKTNEVNLSMPESIEYFEFKLEEAEKLHASYKSGERKQEHSFSMSYAKKAVNETKKNLELAKKLWA